MNKMAQSGRNTGSERLWTVLFGALLTAAVLLFAVYQLGIRSVYRSDEGFYFAMAQNMTRSASYVIRPSAVPFGDFELTCMNLFHPPLNSMLCTGV